MDGLNDVIKAERAPRIPIYDPNGQKLSDPRELWARPETTSPVTDTGRGRRVLATGSVSSYFLAVFVERNDDANVNIR